MLVFAQMFQDVYTEMEKMAGLTNKTAVAARPSVAHVWLVCTWWHKFVSFVSLSFGVIRFSSPSSAQN